MSPRAKRTSATSATVATRSKKRPKTRGKTRDKRTSATRATTSATVEGRPLQVEWWGVERVIPYPQNAKQHPENQIAILAKVIKNFGWQQPIVVDGDGTIIAGHARRLAALSLGQTEVPVVVASHLTPEQTRLLRIADNRTAELAGWEEDLLSIELDALKQFEEIDLTLTGFNEAQLKRYTQRMNGGSETSAPLVSAEEHLVLLELESEEQAQAIYDEMNERGIQCRLLT